MVFEFDIPGVSIFRSPLPLTSQIESDYSYCLPQSLENVAQTRKHNFVAGRYCAIQAAKKLGLSLPAFGNAETREPLWPKGFTGSISHSKSLAISCVSDSSQYQSMGIDAEEIIRSTMAEKISGTVATQEELDYLNSFKLDFGFTLLFSAKEALFKALFPLGRKYIDFKEAILIDIDQQKKTFQLRLASKDPAYQAYLGIYQGQYSIVDNNLVSLILIGKGHNVYS